jgi:MYXO-CTERM domain-containing protein
MAIRFSAVAAIAACSLVAVANADLYVPFDTTNPVGTGWTQSMDRNDDQSSALIDIGMDFCFYEQHHTSLYINNNGNITFDGPVSTFSSVGFPNTFRPMIAPFWADVDTRAGATSTSTNLVWHKSIDTNNDGSPDQFVVTWDGVGFYYQNNSLLNTFQLILSSNENGFGTGLNAAFSYGSMNWTTGDASNGSGGFGGVPATVGINKGDGTTSDQIGRFDNGSNVFDPEHGGVHSLDNRLYFFNACQGVVPTPGTLGLIGVAGLAAARRRRA